MPFLVDHLGQIVAKPLRDALWRFKRGPFWHSGVRGLKFELQPGQHIDYYIYTSGAFEKRFLFLVDALLPLKRTVLDVGANIGNHALFFSTVFDSVYAFEPNPAVLARLKRNVERNRVGNLFVQEFGLSDRNALLPFALNDDANMGRGSFVDDPSQATASLPVRIGDEAVEACNARDIDFIKLDIEGHELQALNGLSKTIAAHRPCIAFEFQPALFPEGYFAGFQEALSGYDFYDCIFRPRQAGAVRKMLAYLGNGGLPWIEPLTPPMKANGDKYHQNILAVPREQRFSIDLPLR